VRLAVAALAATTVTLLAGSATSPGFASSVADGPTCTESSTRQVVDSFIDAFNKGDTARLDQLFPDFVLYATDAPGEFSSAEPRSRSDLIAYFTERHQVHERLNLESFTFHLSSTGGGEFEFEVTRSADDLLAPTPYGGKGGVSCRTTPHTLFLWAMGRETYLRVRLPLYGVAATLALTVLVAGLATVVRRKRHRVSERRPKAGAQGPPVA
jgi:hypothetical protein